jgi:hypothetical protein
MMGMAVRAAAAAVVVAIGGCGALPPVQPWEKGLLAKRGMSFGEDRLEAQFAEHTYNSKEGAAGGAGVGGGGCGCN